MTNRQATFPHNPIELLRMARRSLKQTWEDATRYVAKRVQRSQHHAHDAEIGNIIKRPRRLNANNIIANMCSEYVLRSLRTLIATASHPDHHMDLATEKESETLSGVPWCCLQGVLGHSQNVSADDHANKAYL